MFIIICLSSPIAAAVQSPSPGEEEAGAEGRTSEGGNEEGQVRRSGMGVDGISR